MTKTPSELTVGDKFIDNGGYVHEIRSSVVYSPDGFYTAWNQYGELLYFYPREELVLVEKTALRLQDYASR